MTDYASIFAVRVAPHIVVNVLVRPGEETKNFKKEFPDAMAHNVVVLSDNPVARVQALIESHKLRLK